MQELPENLSNAIKEIFENLNNDTKAAMNQNTLVISVLYAKVAQRLAVHQCTLDDIIRHPKALEQFNSSQRLETVLKIHAKFSVKSADDPIPLLAKKIFERRDLMWELASKISQVHHLPQDLAFTLLVQSYAQSNGASLNDIIQHPKAKQYFESGRLLRAKMIYQELKQGKTEETPEKAARAAEVDLDDRANAEVRRLARQHAQPGAAGLFTQAGIKPAMAADQDKMKAGVRQVMREEHPDRNPEGNKDRFQAAADIKNLMDKDLLDQYLAELERLRELADKKAEAAPLKRGPK